MYVPVTEEAFRNEINARAWLLALRSLVGLLFSHCCPTTQCKLATIRNRWLGVAASIPITGEDTGGGINASVCHYRSLWEITLHVFF